MIFWNPDDPSPHQNHGSDPDNDGTLYFVLLTLVMWLVVVLAQMFR